MNNRPFIQSPWVNGCLFLGAIALLFYTNPHAVGKHNLIRLFWILGTLFLGLRTFYFGVVKRASRNGIKNIALLLMGLLTLFFVLEASFLFVRTTVGAAQALCTQSWFEKHWFPINEKGFRDSQATTAEAIQGKKQLVFLGDSFTAGQGIKNPKDRFPDRVRKELSAEEWAVFNWGECGADTHNEMVNLGRMDRALIHPETVILQWFVNDIEGAARRSGITYQPELPLMHIPGASLLLNRSYFLNYLYTHTPWQTDFGYGAYLETVYGNPRVLKQYEAEFTQFVSLVEETFHSKLMIVVFPSMSRPETSQPYVEYLLGFAAQKDLPTLDMSDEILSLTPQERRVNAFDDHPSKKVHQLTAERILEQFISVPQSPQPAP